VLKVITLIVFAFFFLFQSILLTGGIKTKKYIVSAQPFLLEVVPVSTLSLSAQDLIIYTDAVCKKFPMLQSYFDPVKKTIFAQKDQINNASDFVNVVTQSLQRQVNFYILRRIAWITGGWLLLLALVLYNKRPQYAATGYTSLTTTSKMKF